jgi:hypothetical protein
MATDAARVRQRVGTATGALYACCKLPNLSDSKECGAWGKRKVGFSFKLSITHWIDGFNLDRSNERGGVRRQRTVAVAGSTVHVQPPLGKLILRERLQHHAAKDHKLQKGDRRDKHWFKLWEREQLLPDHRLVRHFGGCGGGIRPSACRGVRSSTHLLVVRLFLLDEAAAVRGHTLC